MGTDRPGVGPQPESIEAAIELWLSCETGERLWRVGSGSAAVAHALLAIRRNAANAKNQPYRSRTLPSGGMHLIWRTRASKQRPVSQRLAFIRPCLAVPGKVPPKGDQWVHEAKWDGYRIQIVKNGSDVRLYSKRGTEWTKRLPSIADAFTKLPAQNAILDGELCFCDERGGPNFRALHHAMRKAKPAPERLVVFAFDLLHLKGADLRAKPLQERRRRMVDLVSEKPIPCMFIGDHFANGAALLVHCERFGLEGVVSKRRDAPYVSGECKAWVKSKCAAWKEKSRERWRSFEEAPLRDTTTGHRRR